MMQLHQNINKCLFIVISFLISSLLYAQKYKKLDHIIKTNSSEMYVNPEKVIKTGLLIVKEAGKNVDYFRLDWKNETWRLYLVAGTMCGGAFAFYFLSSQNAVAISQSTIDHLATWGIAYPASDEHGKGFIPTTVFNFTSIKGIVLALVGGFLIGFGSRYGEGCTSGHAISGLSHLRLPSLITVIGFFIGGLLMTHLIMPLIFG